MLYELRFLDVEERVTCARYVAEHQLNGEVLCTCIPNL